MQLLALQYFSFGTYTFFFVPSSINGNNSSAYLTIRIITEVLLKHQYIYIFLPFCCFIKMKYLNPYTLLNLIIDFPSLKEFSKCLENSPGLVYYFSPHFLTPILFPLLAESMLSSDFLYLISLICWDQQKSPYNPCLLFTHIWALGTFIFHPKWLSY